MAILEPIFKYITTIFFIDFKNKSLLRVILEQTFTSQF